MRRAANGLLSFFGKKQTISSLETYSIFIIVDKYGKVKGLDIMAGEGIHERRIEWHE
ncbi:hypothetical protein [Aneurinibacillus tyrosinisolvens]|uniref:hypothetical protein n=1 Tax=Aneurinibacillus tyrosinisolvens TaxID=1443435 RepID=UPI00137938A3|nr:hypothetical protein [Aneurinibacillus tyrosinisolvens]